MHKYRAGRIVKGPSAARTLALEMPLHNLPPEILYQILGEVVASYVERAVTSPPIDGWETLDSELHSEWFTDEEDSSDDDVDFASDVYESEEESRTSSSGSDNAASNANGSSSIALTSSGAPEPNPASNQQIASVALSEEESSAMEIWASEQERTLDPENMLEFKLYLWNVLELREGLPRNDIAPLLSVCRYVRETTIKVLEDSIGVKRTADGSLDCNPWHLLRVLRKHYRLAHTQPFDLPPAEYPARMTPLVECYCWLSGLSYSLRQMGKLVYMDPEESQEAIQDMLNLSYMADVIPQQVFRPRIDQRSHALLVHMRRFISVSMYCADITCTYKEMFSLKGTARHPGFIIHDDKIPAFSKAVQSFVQFDRKHMDKKKYPELPGPLVDLSGVVRILSNVKKLKYVSEFRRKREIMASTHEAIQLLEKWKRRAELSSYILLES